MNAPRLEPIPPEVLCAADYAAHAQRRLDANAWAYFDSHAGEGLARRANHEAWNALTLLPRALRGVRAIDTGQTLLGRPLPYPLLIAPMALQRMVHPDGELGMAFAAAAQGAGMVLGSEASVALEAVAAAVHTQPGRGPLWFQFHFLADRSATLELVRRAEAAGYEALVLTVDSQVRAQRPAQQRAGFRLPAGISTVNLPPATAPSLPELLRRAPDWDDVTWLQAQTPLPLLLKGVLHPADARQAARLQLSGLIVSNHGGRALDAAAATAPALAHIADAVGEALPLLVDGGIHRGTDMLKALALGARAVLVGRPLLWALATAGAAGAAHVLRLLHDELLVAMAQCGAGSLQQLERDLLLTPATYQAAHR